MTKRVDDIGPSDELRQRVTIAFREDEPLPVTIVSKRKLRIDSLNKQKSSGDIEATAVDLESHRVVKLFLPREPGSRARAEILPRYAF